MDPRASQLAGDLQHQCRVGQRLSSDISCRWALNGIYFFVMTNTVTELPAMSMFSSLPSEPADALAVEVSTAPLNGTSSGSGFAGTT